MRIASQILVLALALFAGFWFRGGEAQNMTVWTVAALAFLVLLADLLGSPDSRSSRIGAAVLAGMLFSVGWYLGGRELEAASADCANRIGEVRAALQDYRDQQGQYPDSLNQLDGVELPGKRLLRGSLLEYTPTVDGYLLSYRDGRFRFTATEDREPFLEGQIGQ